jgi:tripartite-type tricarboxylate transporter receptor subunit TctC
MERRIGEGTCGEKAGQPEGDQGFHVFLPFADMVAITIRPMKILLMTATAIVAALAAPLATAQGTYPTRPVKIVAPFAPGGLADVLARAVGERLQRSLGQPVIVENRPGAGGNVGADAVARAEADGHTLLMSSAGILTINEFLYEKMAFDPRVAFAPVSIVADMPMLLVVRADLPAPDAAQFIHLAREKPLFYGSPGHGTTGHLGMELFMHATGLKLQHVPYKSAAEAVQAALAGHTAAMFDNPPTVMAQIRAGGLRALGVAAKERISSLPNVPTLSESGVTNFEASSWFGLVVPAKTPPSVVDRLAADTASAVKDPQLQKRFADLGARLLGDTPTEFARRITEERARWGEVIRSAGIKLQ